MIKSQWMSTTLKLAAVYNLLWGLLVVLFPAYSFEILGLTPLNHPMVWQGMGMVIGVYGLGYWWAAQDPLTHWPIVAVGFLGKILGPMGFFINYFAGKVPVEFLFMLITNDFIWWIPFFLILKAAHQQQKITWI